MLIIRGVNLYPSQVEAVLVGVEGLSAHYLLIVERVGTMDRLTVEVELDAAAAATPERYAQMEVDIAHHLKSMIGLTARVIASPPGPPGTGGWPTSPERPADRGSIRASARAAPRGSRPAASWCQRGPGRTPPRPARASPARPRRP